jgi:hypothetical protein
MHYFFPQINVKKCTYLDLIKYNFFKNIKKKRYIAFKKSRAGRVAQVLELLPTRAKPQV